MVPRSHRPQNSNYRSLLETLLPYGNDAATTHLTNAMWILDDGNLTAYDPTAADSTNKGFMTRWNYYKERNIF